ncbi:CYFA0S02e03884g1_1 [Cyberlindnera fabianii]|uniref:CYFA0S02e03884g1_1 n=1 Tax=Cyberlindnera fabianii TaxID=36022 RepID=A0A061AM62_CYBFA|nr:CYFA0S02e03884g1_1 [Cyberlindnera fabianii]
MTQNQLESAEGVTKFLRAKNTSLDDIVKVSTQLLNDELDVYLPNRLSFVFDLLIDRFNDSKQNKYKESMALWKLFNKTWILLDKDVKTRTRSYKGFKFHDALVGALSHIQPFQVEPMLTTLTETINLVRLSTSVLSTQDVSIKILTLYLEHLSSLKGDTSTQISDICAFFKASLPAEKYTPKFTTAFVTSALPPLLKLLNSTSNTQPLIALLKKAVFNRESSSAIKDNTALLLKQDLDTKSVVAFFKLIVDALSKNDIVTLEDIYTMITEKYPDASEKQLEYLQMTKRTLSASFIEMVFDIEFSNDSQNWRLIHCILQLDIEVGVSHGEEIMKKLEEQPSSEYLAIGGEILDAHSRARDLAAFFHIWLHLLEKPESIWSSEEFKGIVSKCIVSLSASQLTQLVSDVLDSDCGSKFVVLSTIVQGVFSIKDLKIRLAPKDILKQLFDQQTKDSEEVWDLRFQLLCLYEDILSENQAKELAKIKVKKAYINQFYTMFRAREIYEFDVADLTHSFTKFVKISESQTSILEATFRRWFVFVNYLFSSDDIDVITDLLLKNETLTVTLIQNALLFEQTKIIESIINKIHKEITLSQIVTDFHASILISIPIQCYARRSKAPLLDSLTSQLTTQKTPSESIITLTTHLLKTPTFKSKLESDVGTIMAVSEHNSDSKIFEVIWTNVVANLRDEAVLEYAASLINVVKSQLKKQKQLSYVFYLANIVLSTATNNDKLDTVSLQNTFIDATNSLLKEYLTNSKKKTTQVTWLLKAIFELDLDATYFELLKQSLKNFGEAIQQTNENEAKAALFMLLAKFSNHRNASVQYFESLYIVLRESGVTRSELKSGLLTVVSGLEDSEFATASEFVLSSFDSSSPSNLVVEIASTYLHELRRTNDHATGFVVKTLSKLLMHFSTLQPPSLIVALNTFKTLLTEKTWAFTQYSLELLITFLSRCTDSLQTHNHPESVELFTTITHTLSNIILFHRYRLSNRHHIVLSVFTSLLTALTKSRHSSPLQSSRIAAEAFQRVLTNLCEPPQSRKERNSEDLNSSAAVIKRSLRKHLYVVLLTYVHLSLKVGYESEVRELILPGIFSVFDVLSQNELVLVSTSLDYSGRVYYRTVYDEYKKAGKWQTD